MKKFEIIDITTADIAFKAYGKDINELFENSAFALFSIIGNVSKVEKKIKKEVKCEAKDLISLMFNWLNELLFLSDSEYIIFSDFKVDIKRIDEKNFILNAICEGETIDEKKHEIKTNVKAATYHNMKIEKKDFWEAQVILDV
jgi:SHS2 domain-containing protein